MPKTNKPAAETTPPVPLYGRYLLYIDILGFSEIAGNEPDKVEQIYRVLDSLNVHSHASFKTIVFSDTVLVYNPELATTTEDAAYIVWYLIEFAEDLHHRLTGQDVFFRALLTSGEFTHYKLDHVECFFGNALIAAHKQEKSLPAIGLFISNECNAYNKYFRTAPFNKDLSFVYLNRSLETLHEESGGNYPVPNILTESTPYVPSQVRFLHDVHTAMRAHKEPLVRAKYLMTWDYYMQRYPELLSVLEANSFNLSSLGTGYAWTDEIATMREDIAYFSKRIGR
ncbi:hypothetical protein [Granulicella aggregans]|uniref:hypothetical protein n=1 Tax=Granulicella aggregans TaxID=474949 RepID=UPI0021E08579|nr:hypothetical protein [Granulicella aggregans]